MQGYSRRALLAVSRRAAKRSPQPALVQARRTFFGVGEILGVLANPGETLRQISESKKLLEDARKELQTQKEKSQIPPSHTFAPLPSFFKREREQAAIERCLSGVPSFQVLFGASSVGKTALLRQILSSSKYHVLHYDCRIAGFADLSSLYLSLATQLEAYFITISHMEGYDVFEQESWAFKHDRGAVEERVKAGGDIKTADVARLMERFQSSLLKYWEFEPEGPERPEQENQGDEKPDQSEQKASSLKRQGSITERTVDTAAKAEETDRQYAEGETQAQSEEKPKTPTKMVPVLLLDEAHKLPALLQSDETMKSLLDSFLVLTKQDRLLHVVLATSDSFFMQHLRQMNILQHCYMMTVGDPSYEEAKAYYHDQLEPTIPNDLKSKIDFEDLYDYFGGKLTHLADFVSDWVNSEGTLPLYESSHFLQAVSLLNLQLVHAGASEESKTAGFEIYSSVPGPEQVEEQGFTAEQLLRVLHRLQDAKQVPWQLDYFQLCRELGVHVVNAMVRSRTLELRWSPAPSLEGRDAKRVPFTGPILLPATPVLRAAMAYVIDDLEKQGVAPSEKQT